MYSKLTVERKDIYKLINTNIFSKKILNFFVFTPAILLNRKREIRKTTLRETNENQIDTVGLCPAGSYPIHTSLFEQYEEQSVIICDLKRYKK